MRRVSRVRAAASLAAAVVALESCHDGLIHAPASALTASVNMTVVVDASRGGEATAFDRSDRVFARFRAGTDVRFEQEVPFSPSTGVAVVRIEVPLRQSSEQLDADIELRAGSNALFRGSATSTLSVATRTPVTITPTPVVAALTCGPDVQIESYGLAGRLQGAALFATGDTISASNAPITWTAPSSAVATVTSAGDVTALQDGDLQASCSSSGFTGTRTIHVFATVADVEVAPATTQLAVRSTVTLRPTLRDAHGNPIPSHRPITWTSANTAVATVDADGVVTGVALGTVQIDAKSGKAVGSSQITVILPAPIVATNAATGITGTSATLNATVNPNGASTSVWFEWGTDSALATAQSTKAQSLPAGSADVAVSESIGGLSIGTAYFFRVVASNSPGAEVRGQIVKLITARPPLATTSDPTITSTAYTLRGIVNPNGSATAAWFQVGTVTGTFDGPPPPPTTFTDTPHQNVGAGTSPISISEVLTVQPFVTYFVRAVGSNAAGTTLGSLVSFTAGSRPVLGQTSGFLGGTCSGGSTCVQMSSSVNPEFAPTEAWFEVGRDTLLTTFTSTAHQAIAPSFNNTPFSASLAVAAGTPVFFRAAASNALGTVRGVVIHAFPQVIILGKP